MPLFREHWIRCIATIVLLLLAIHLCFTNLNKTVSASDESLHLTVVQEMYQSGNWWLPRYEGEPYFRKPPFKMWLSVLPLKLFGESNVSYRVIDATLGVLFIGAVLLFGSLLLKNFWAGYLGAFFLLFNRAFLISSHGYRHGTQDPMLHVLQFGAMALFLIWVQRFQRGVIERQTQLSLAYGLCIGFSVLTKNVLGFVAPGLAFLYLCLRLEVPAFLRQYWREICLALTLSLVIPAAYMVPHFIWTPGAFENLFLSEVVDRVAEGMHNQERYWYYFEKIYRWEFIPIPPLLAALGFAAYFGLYKKDPVVQYLGVWAVVPIALFSLVPSRLLWYIAECYPALALLSGMAIVHLFRVIFRSPRTVKTAVPAALVLFFVFYPWIRYTPRFWRTAHKISARAQIDRAVDVLQEFPESRLLVYGMPFQWNVKYQSRVEKLYLRRLGKQRLTVALDFEKFLQQLADPEYDFAIVPRARLEESRRAFRPHSFVRLFPFHHRNEKLFLLSRIDTRSSLFEPSRPVEAE